MSDFRINCMKVLDIEPLTGADYKISLSLQMTDWQKRETAAQLLGSMPTDEVEQFLRSEFAELFDDAPVAPNNPGESSECHAAAGSVCADGECPGKAAQSPVAHPLPTKDALADIIADGLRGTYHCTRVWSAWSYGTMGPDDFAPVDKSDTSAELADAILAALAATAPVAQPVPRTPLLGTYYCCEKAVGTGSVVCPDCAYATTNGAAPAPEAQPCTARHVCDCQEAGIACQRTEPTSVAWPLEAHPLTQAIQRLNRISYNIQKSECIEVLRHLRAELAAPPAAARVPLTPDRIAVMAAKAGFSPALVATDGGAFGRLARAIEAAGQEGGAA